MFLIDGHQIVCMGESNRTYVCLKMNENGGEPVFAYLGEIEASTHHVAKNKAQEQFDIRASKLTETEGIAVIPKRSWHTYLVQ